MQTACRQAGRHEQADRQETGTQAEVRQKDKCPAERAGGRKTGRRQTVGRQTFNRRVDKGEKADGPEEGRQTGGRHICWRYSKTVSRAVRPAV
jgi:hypothetical protein